MALSDSHTLAGAGAALPPLCAQDATADPSTEARFTYTSLHERLPKILDETGARNITSLGADAVHLIQTLRNDLAADELLAPPERYCDASKEVVAHRCLPEWQSYCAPLVTKGLRWSQIPWFFAENYTYAIVNHIMATCSGPADPFHHQKEEALTTSAEPFLQVLGAVSMQDAGANQLQAALLAALWGNKADLSLTAGAAYVHGPSKEAPADEHLLANDLDAVLALLRTRVARPATELGSGVESGAEGGGEVTIVLDNCGLELLCDLVLTDALLTSRSAARVVLLAKAAPVFVSDAMVKDVHRHMEFIAQLGRDAVPARARDASSHETSNISGLEGAPSSDAAGSDVAVRQAALASELQGRLLASLAAGSLQIREEPFLHGPQPFWEMPTHLREWWSAPQCKLVVTKGDANYRRLLGDRHWPHSTPFASATSYFPAPLLALRTCKSGVGVGIAESEEKRARLKEDTWLVSGKFGVVQLKH